MKSKVYNLSDEDFIALVKSKNTYSDILRALDLTPRGGSSSDTLKRRIKELNIDISHFCRSKGEFHKRRSNEDIFIEHSTFLGTSHLKQRILDDNLIEYKCAFCGNEGEWRGQKLILQLDHINGVHDDNRLNNLRFLCPNCHSTTNTYAGKNQGNI